MTKLLYIATAGRSGSTLLERTLGSGPGWCAVGEMSWVFQRGVVDNLRCGCGERFHDCEFWPAAYEHAYGAMDPVVANALGLQWREHRVASHLPMLVGAKTRQAARRGALPATDAVVRLYEAAAKESGAAVVVDSSKIPLRPAFLEGRTDVDLFVLHLVRDPRGVAFSWGRTKEGEEGTSLHASSVFKPAAWWVVTNETIRLSCSGLGPRLRTLRYEEFASEPARVLSDLADWVGEPLDVDRLVTRDGLSVGRTHAFSGNPDRFRTGTIPLQVDDRWKSEMSARDRGTVTAMTLPWLGRYGYPAGG
ncbi:MAG TPA: hypothetical protein VGS21_06405 [Acidimicrobiales bacterium]|nr:hypothetical protein [Acidimicrobiales bacterium]